MIRIHLSDGTREVTVKLEGDGHATLQQAERAAKRLFAAITKAPPAPRSPFGFSLDGTELIADTERAEQADHEDDE